jgi:hypothetical protein
MMKNVNKGLFVKTLLVTMVVTFVVSPARALPPDPDNAALLYYQAFLTLAQLSDEARDRIGKVALGETTPDDQVREDINRCAGAIQFAEAAVKVPTCHWGVRYSQGFDALMPQLAQMRFLTYVLIADARVRAADGDYKGALERCLMTGTFARHIGDDTVISYLVSIAVRDVEYRCMQDVVACAADDTELLQWLKTELATSGGVTVSIVRPLKIEIELVNDLMRMGNIKKLARFLSNFNEKKADQIVRAANEQVLRRARQIYTEHMNKAVTILSTPMPYEQAHSQLKHLRDDLDPNDPVSMTVKAFFPAYDKFLSQKTAIETQANAIEAAIEILLSRAKTGRLPDALPSGLPKEAFSGKDFKYEKTKEGFILRCPGKDLHVYWYEFKIKK